MMEMRITIKVTGEKQDLAHLLSLVNDLVVDHSETELVYLRSVMEDVPEMRFVKPEFIFTGLDGHTSTLKDGGNE